MPAEAARRRLFQEADGSALRLYVRPGAAKVELAPLVLAHGGRLCRAQEPGALLLARPGEAQAGGGGLRFVSTQYVAGCVARGRRLPLEPYRLRAGAPSGAGRAPPLPRRRHVPGRERPPRQPPRGPEAPPAGGAAAAAASSGGEAEDEPQQESHAADLSEESSIFQIANKEFEENEGGCRSLRPAEDVPPKCTELETSEESAPPNPKTRVLEVLPGEASVPQSPSPREEQPSGPSAVEVARAVEDMRRFMDEFRADLAAVTQALLKNSGEVAAAACCLQTGQRSDGRPLWSRQDDLALLKEDGHLQSKLIAKYGAENVNRRVAFRSN